MRSSTTISHLPQLFLTINAHAATLGHEMQFATMVERGVSTAPRRLCFKFTPSGLRCLTFRLGVSLSRSGIGCCAHGENIPAEASRILLEDVAVSEAMLTQETERYMFRAPSTTSSFARDCFRPNCFAKLYSPSLSRPLGVCRK